MTLQEALALLLCFVIFFKKELQVYKMLHDQNSIGPSISKVYLRLDVLTEFASRNMWYIK